MNIAASHEAAYGGRPSFERLIGLQDAFIIAQIRVQAPDLLQWYPDYEAYFDDFLDRYVLGDSPPSGIPLECRFFVDTDEERVEAVLSAHDAVIHSARLMGLTKADKKRSFDKAVFSLAQDIPEEFLGDPLTLAYLLSGVKNPLDGQGRSYMTIARSMGFDVESDVVRNHPRWRQAPALGSAALAG
jgi:hypothetical protein